ncbi:MAG: DNA methyltransferase, partial [Fervidobacterium sp.]
MEATELDLPATPAFGKYKEFLSHAELHPAKANTNLIEFLILQYTKEGDTILDPMAGSGSTGVIAALHGRNAILVELEEKFVKWIKQAIENVEKTQTLAPKGKIWVIHGDARKLSELLKNETDIVITSPPYGDGYSIREGGEVCEEYVERR